MRNPHIPHKEIPGDQAPLCEVGESSGADLAQPYIGVPSRVRLEDDELAIR